MLIILISIPIIIFMKGFILGLMQRKAVILILLSTIINPQAIFAAGTVITFTSLDELLWSIVVTIQHYTLPIMSITLVFLGIKLVASGDDTATKDLVKNWMIRILIGGVFIFGAAMLADLIKLAVGG